MKQGQIRLLEVNVGPAGGWWIGGRQEEKHEEGRDNMFWESVGRGLGVLTYWQTYIAGLMWLALAIGPTILIAATSEKLDRAGSFVGVGMTLLVVPICQSFAMVVFALTMAPIILGISQDAAWLLPWTLTIESPLVVGKFVGVLLLASVVLTIIPILGRVHSLHICLVGTLSLALYIGLIGKENPAIAPATFQFWPGFWFAMGLLILVAFLTFLGVAMAAVLGTVIGSIVGENVGRLMMLPVVAPFGFVPLFIYGAWLGNQLRT